MNKKESKNMVDLDAVFSDFDNADPSNVGGRNPKITTAGEFVVEVEECRCVESKQYNAVYYVAELKVIESNTDNVAEGSKHSWVHNMLEKFFGASNTKQFIAAAAGLDVASEEAKAIGRSEVEESWGEDQPLKGVQLNLKTFPKTTKSGRDIVVHEWSPL